MLRCGELLRKLRLGTGHNRSVKSFVANFEVPWGEETQRNFEDNSTQFGEDELGYFVKIGLVLKGSDFYLELYQAIQEDIAERERFANVKAMAKALVGVTDDTDTTTSPPESSLGLDQSGGTTDDDEKRYASDDPNEVPHNLNQTMWAAIHINRQMDDVVKLLREISAKLDRL